MIRNVSTLDRTVRLMLGALLAVGVGSYAGLFLLGFGPVPVVLGTTSVTVAGVTLLVIGAGRISPLYLSFDTDTFDDRD